MGAVENVEGTVAWIEKRRAVAGDVVEFELKSADDRSCRVQMREIHDGVLRAGNVVVVWGQMDPNGILVAQKIALVRGTVAEPMAHEVPLVPVATVPRWLAYAFAGVALMALVLFLIGMASLNQGRDFPQAAAVLGALILVTTGSGGARARGTANALLRYGAKCVLLYALIIWWGFAVNDTTPEDLRPLALVAGLLAVMVAGRLDHRELAMTLHPASGEGAAPLGALARLALSAVPCVIVAIALYATTTTDRESIGVALTVAALLLAGLALVLRALTTPSLRTARQLVWFASAIALLAGVSMYARLDDSAPGAIAFVILVILIGRLFAQRITGAA